MHFPDCLVRYTFHYLWSINTSEFTIHNYYSGNIYTILLTVGKVCMEKNKKQQTMKVGIQNYLLKTFAVDWIQISFSNPVFKLAATDSLAKCSLRA